MPTLANPKWERFAQGLAAGKPAYDAYVQAGYNPPPGGGNARRLKRYEAVTQRVYELLERQAKRMELTKEQILQMLLDDRELARREGQASAAMKADELLGKELHRMFVDRKEVGGPGDFDQMTEDELREFISDRNVSTPLPTHAAPKTEQ